MKIVTRFFETSTILVWLLVTVFGKFSTDSINTAIETKVVGGETVERGEIPYQVAVYVYGVFICGGSFVVVKEYHFVITAAHCLIFSQNPSDYIVVAGDVLVDDLGLGQARSVAQIRIHDRFDMPANENDIAILKVDRPFDINHYVSPIRLPRRREKVGLYGVVSGWGSGRISEGGPSSLILIKAKILVGPDSQCKKTFPDVFVPSKMICAGIRNGACKGDSGGPLRDYKRGFLAGIVSFNKNNQNCTKPWHNAVYTRVSGYVDWITAQKF